MVTLSLKSETTNAKGKMNPCHSPSQKPATEPFAPGEFLKRFGPAAQPAAKHRVNTRKRPKTATNGFFTTPPKERSGLIRQIVTGAGAIQAADSERKTRWKRGPVNWTPTRS